MINNRENQTISGFNMVRSLLLFHASVVERKLYYSNLIRWFFRPLLYCVSCTVAYWTRGGAEFTATLNSLMRDGGGWRWKAAPLLLLQAFPMAVIETRLVTEIERETPQIPPDSYTVIIYDTAYQHVINT